MTRNRLWFVFLPGLLCASLACAEQDPAVTEDHSGYYSQGLHVATAPDALDEKALLLQKLQTVQEALTQLRGQVEVQKHQLKILSEQQKAQFNDLNSRLGQRTTTEPTAQPVADAVKTKMLSEQVQYAQAIDAVRKKNYDAAKSQLISFLKQYPDSKYTPNAYYWLGELYLIKDDTKAATEAFKTIVTKFPDSNKKSAAMLKLGYAYLEQGERAQGRKWLEAVKSELPGTSLARLADNRLTALDDIMSHS